MKNKKIRLFVTGMLLVVFLGIRSTCSKLNITFKYNMSFVSKKYEVLTITNTTQIKENYYQISLKNDNDYQITFSCEDINSNFDVICSTNKVFANSTANILVDLNFKSGIDTSTLTPNPNGSGYITKIGIRITNPYAYPETDPHYVCSNDMIVVELVVTNLAEHITALSSTDTANFARDHSTNLRYIGADPQNYVSFNNELWRILGIIDGKVKIVRTIPFNLGGI